MAKPIVRPSRLSASPRRGRSQHRPRCPDRTQQAQFALSLQDRDQNALVTPSSATSPTTTSRAYASA
jgi:hypothetical protein